MLASSIRWKETKRFQVSQLSGYFKKGATVFCITHSEGLWIMSELGTLQNSLEVLEGRDGKWGTWVSMLTLLSQISD